MKTVRDAAITWVSGLEYCSFPELEVYFASLERCGFEGDRLVFTHDMEPSFRAKIEKRGFRVIDIRPEAIEWEIRDRFLAVWNFLCRNEGRYRYIMLSDSRDVLFQRNPIEYLERRYQVGEEFLLLVEEGMPHSTSEWNMNAQAACQKHVKRFRLNFSNWPVVNSGVEIGTQRRIKDFAFLLWSTTLLPAEPVFEQAMLNYLAGYLRSDSDYTFINPTSCPLVATGEVIKLGQLQPPPTFENGMWGNPALGESYYIVHQWERTPHGLSIARSYGVTP